MSWILKSLLDGASVGRRGEPLPLDADIWWLHRSRTGPEKVAVRIGRIDDPLVDSAQVWEETIGLRDRIERRKSVFEPEVRSAMKAYLVRSAKRHTGASTSKVLGGLVAFEEWCCLEQDHVPGAPDQLVGLLDAWAARSFKQRYSNARTIQRFFAWARKIQAPGFAELNLPDPKYYRRRPGQVAKLGHPRKGAFGFLEFREIRKAVWDPDPRSEEEVRLTTWVFLETGARPIQVKGLLRGGLRKSEIRDAYFLDMPRAKGTVYRSQTTTEREISIELGDAILAYITRGERAPASEPMFPRFRAQKTRERNKAMKRFARVNKLTTVRLPPIESKRYKTKPAPLPLTPTRFRYTAATQLAIRGASPEQIASFLDDDTLDMARVYANAAASMVDLLNQTLDEYPLWRSVIESDFLGIIDDEPDGAAIFAGVANLDGFAALARRRLEIGRCTKKDPCELLPPLSCYLCAFFRATTNPQPHRSQLIQLKRHAESGADKGYSDRMAEVLLPWMLAIKDVLCELESTAPRSALAASISSREL